MAPQCAQLYARQLKLEELRGRPITRDIDWGVTIPLDGYDDKRIYVWYDAVIGYLSAAVEWAQVAGEPEAWREWWDAGVNPEALIYNFIGKDNIPFHTIIWPGMLMGYNAPELGDDGEQLNLPYDVPANEYLNLGGGKFSTSRGNVIGFNSIMHEFQPDAVRYVLTAQAPETSDVEFTWQDFMDRINNELVANWGNLVNRMLGFAYKRYEGVIPTPGPLDEADQALLDEIKGGFESVGALYNGVKLKAALTEVRRLSQRVNQYLNDKAPWSSIKTDPQAAATAVYVALQAIDWLKLMWAPILPHSSEQLHTMLGYEQPLFGRQYTELISDARGQHLALRYDHTNAVGRWDVTALPAGQMLRPPTALFVKLDDEAMEAKLSGV
ncbi:MAG: class I tRNA ligase family protein [Caldilineaceae bacterium]